MKKNVLTLLIVLSINHFGIAQKMIKSKESVPKLAVKLNLFSFLTNSVGPSVEVKLANKLSLNLAGNYHYGISSNRVEQSLNDNGFETNGLTLNRFTGFALTPELRFYPSKKRAALNGFYLGPFFRYARGGNDGTFLFNNKTYNGSLSFRSIGGGLMVGYQWILGNNFVLDWGFFGPRFGAYSMSLRAGPVTQADRLGFINDLNAKLAEFTSDNPNVVIPTNLADSFFDSDGYFGSNRIPLGGLPAVRTTLSIGFSF